SSDLAVVVAAAVALALLIALVPGRLGQLLRLGLQQFVEGFLYAASYQFFDLTLDYFLVKLYNLFGHGLLSPFRMVCRDFILPEGCKPCLFLTTFQFAKLIVPYRPFHWRFRFLDSPRQPKIQRKSRETYVPRLFLTLKLTAPVWSEWRESNSRPLEPHCGVPLLQGKPAENMDDKATVCPAAALQEILCFFACSTAFHTTHWMEYW